MALSVGLDVRVVFENMLFRLGALWSTNYPVVLAQYSLLSRAYALAVATGLALPDWNRFLLEQPVSACSPAVTIHYSSLRILKFLALREWPKIFWIFFVSKITAVRGSKGWEEMHNWLVKEIRFLKDMNRFNQIIFLISSILFFDAHFNEGKWRLRCSFPIFPFDMQREIAYLTRHILPHQWFLVGIDGFTDLGFRI